MAEFTDTHCHLNLNSFENDLPDVLARARQAGVVRILVPGIDLETSRSAVALHQQDNHLYAAVGVHPNDALRWDEHSLEELKALVSRPGVLAIGEIGLDYYRDFASPALQKEIFLAQLDLAKRAGKPVVVHSRAALAEVMATLEAWHDDLVQQGSPLAAAPGVLHSYEGDMDTALKAIQMGFLIGIGGPVTFKNGQERQSLAAGLPLSSILVETDAPYLAPHPYRGKRNEPGFVVEIAEKIAELQHIPVAQVAEITSANADRVFGWRHLD